MNKARILVGLAASIGFAIAAACGGGSSSNSNGSGNGNGGSSGGSSGANSGSSSSGGTTPASSGGTGCASGQALCVGLGGSDTCMDAGSTCFGTTVVANECSTTSACPSGQVCCSSLVGADGGIISYPSASTDAAAATGTGAGVAAEIVAVQCMAECPTNALSSQVCVLEAEGGSPTTCPQGTTCQDYLPSFLASATLPNTLCLTTSDAGYYQYPMPDGGA